VRTLIASQLVTLDGMFEGPDHELVPPPWNAQLEQYGVDMLTKEADTILYGRVTYEHMRAYWPTADVAKQPVARYMNALPKVVVSRALPPDPGWNTRVIRDHVVEELLALKRQSGKSIVLYGSANLMETLVRYDLVDEYVFMINPLIMGGGAPLFRGGPRQLLKHVSTTTCDNGVLLVRYGRDRRDRR
jgi:dihydrofolate reductase